MAKAVGVSDISIQISHYFAKTDLYQTDTETSCPDIIIFIDIYANPVFTKELLEKEKRTGNILL